MPCSMSVDVYYEDVWAAQMQTLNCHCVYVVMLPSTKPSLLLPC